MDDIDHQIDHNAEQAELRQMAQQQGESYAAYQRRKQAWATVRQGNKWVRVPKAPSEASGGFKTVKQEGRWVRVPC